MPRVHSTDDAFGEAAEDAPAQHAPEHAVVRMQQTVGNAAVARSVAAGSTAAQPGEARPYVLASGAKSGEGQTLARFDLGNMVRGVGDAARGLFNGGAAPKLEDALREQDANGIARIRDWSEATDEQRVQALRLLLDGLMVGGRLDAIVRIWESFGPRLAATMFSQTELFRQCVEYGAQIPRLTPADRAIVAAHTQPNILNAHQAGRVAPALMRMDVDDYLALRGLLRTAGNDAQRAFILKAVAAGRSLDDITPFANTIRARDEAWLVANCNVVQEATPEGGTDQTGIAQQWQMSCGPTTVQTMHAQTDPIYALSLRAGGDIHSQNQGNEPMTREQGDILRGQGSAPTPIGTEGRGAWVESDMNKMSGQTGVTYETQVITAVEPANPAGGDVDTALTEIFEHVGRGVHVPLVIGGAPRQTAHYVLGIRASGDRLLVHDPGSGTTGWVTRDQFMNNNLRPPLSWKLLAAWDKPSTARG